MTIETPINNHFEEIESNLGTKLKKTGRPKDSVSLTGEIKKILQIHPDWKRDIAISLITMARHKGYNQLSAINNIIDRIDGKPVESHKIELENPITINFVPYLIDKTDKPKQIESHKPKELEPV